MSLAETIIKQLGVDPAQLQSALAGVVRDAGIVRDKVLGAERGFGDAMTHFQGRLSAIESDLTMIKQALHIASPEIAEQLLVLPKPNEADHA